MLNYYCFKPTIVIKESPYLFTCIHNLFICIGSFKINLTIDAKIFTKLIIVLCAKNSKGKIWQHNYKQ